MEKEDLEEKLRAEVIHCFNGSTLRTESKVELNWVDEDEFGFSRLLNIKTSHGFSFDILWYVNLLTIKLPNGIEIWADDINLSSSYPATDVKLCLGSTFNGSKSGLHIPILKN